MMKCCLVLFSLLLCLDTNAWLSSISRSRYQFIIRNSLTIPALQKDDFPLLQSNPKRLVYLDSAASAQKPSLVIESMNDFYRNSYSNVHRGAYRLASKSTELYEAARDRVQSFLTARHREEIIFTRGATESLNMIALMVSDSLKPGDEIILTVQEHHSNLVPWQMVAQHTGAVLRFVPLNSTMELDLEYLESIISHRTKVISFALVSNVLGSISPLLQIVHLAKAFDTVVVVDACQAIPHMEINVQELGIDFLAASSHKFCGPTGIGICYGKLEHLIKASPVYGGGEMIDKVDLFSSTYAPPPMKFEAGTPPIAEAVGLDAAIQYLTQIGMKKIFEHQQQLGAYLLNELQKIACTKIYGPNNGSRRSGLVALNIDGLHPTDLAFLLDQDGIAVRSGHHCAQPLHKFLNIPGSLRVSPYIYNDKDDIDFFLIKLEEKIKLLKSFK
jgi:cysteine desulfurase/selenocysteine lyase